MDKKTLGWREWVKLPDLELGYIKAKVDTGARSSALHAFDIEPFTTQDGEQWVSFRVHPQQHSDALTVECRAPVKDRRKITDSGGHRTTRYIIETTMVLGEDRFTAEMSLVQRYDMLFRMLLGRTALKGSYVVDPARSFVTGRHHEDPKHRNVTE